MQRLYEIYDGVSGGAYNGGRYLSRSISSKSKTPLFSAGDSDEPLDDETGGIIVLCADAGVSGYDVRKVMSGCGLVHWSVGHYMGGKFVRGRDGEQFDWHSLAVTMPDADIDGLFRIARRLSEVTGHRSSLLKDSRSGKVFLLK